MKFHLGRLCPSSYWEMTPGHISCSLSVVHEILKPLRERVALAPLTPPVCQVLSKVAFEYAATQATLGAYAHMNRDRRHLDISRAAVASAVRTAKSYCLL